MKVDSSIGGDGFSKVFEQRFYLEFIGLEGSDPPAPSGQPRVVGVVNVPHAIIRSETARFGISPPEGSGEHDQHSVRRVVAVSRPRIGSSARDHGVDREVFCALKMSMPGRAVGRDWL